MISLLKLNKMKCKYIFFIYFDVLRYVKSLVKEKRMFEVKKAVKRIVKFNVRRNIFFISLKFS